MPPSRIIAWKPVRLALLDLLAAHPEINRHLDRAALAKLCDPVNYLGQSGVMVDRVLASLRGGGAWMLGSGHRQLVAGSW